MRHDMQKILVEKERIGHRNRGIKLGKKYDPCLDYDEVDYGPVGRISTSRRRHSDPKQLNENLTPLYKYLRSRLGQPWNDVYSDIMANLDGRSVVGKHLLDHLGWDVERYAAIIDGKIQETRGGHTYREVSGFYVHPETGLLCEAQSRYHGNTHYVPRASELEVDYVYVDEELYYARDKETRIWYRWKRHIEMRDTYGTIAGVWGVIKSTPVWAEVRTQAGKREIKKFKRYLGCNQHYMDRVSNGLHRYQEYLTKVKENG